MCWWAVGPWGCGLQSLQISNVLAGDYLLARASVSLAALRNSEIVRLMSEVLEELVSGEIMQVCAVRALCVPWGYKGVGIKCR